MTLLSIEYPGYDRCVFVVRSVKSAGAGSVKQFPRNYSHRRPGIIEKSQIPQSWIQQNQGNTSVLVRKMKIGPRPMHVLDFAFCGKNVNCEYEI